MEWIRTAPLLSEAVEAALIDRWHQHGDQRAVDELAASHMRLIAKIARGYRGYGLPLEDLMSEGTIGFMRALNRFEHGHGARLATFAVWSIRAAINAYVLGNWSMVKVATTAPQRKLFFKLRGLKARILSVDQGDMSYDDVKYIATELGVPIADVVAMNRRLAGGDASLNTSAGADGDGDSLQDHLVDDREDQEYELAHRESDQLHRGLLAKALDCLGVRERMIFTERRLAERPRSLERLAVEYGISPERVRQIELSAMAKVEAAAKAGARQLGLATTWTATNHPRRRAKVRPLPHARRYGRLEAAAAA